MRVTFLLAAFAITSVTAGPHHWPRQDDPSASTTMSMGSMTDMTSSTESTGTPESGSGSMSMTMTSPMPSSTGSESEHGSTHAGSSTTHASTPSATSNTNGASKLDMSVAGALVGALAFFI